MVRGQTVEFRHRRIKRICCWTTLIDVMHNCKRNYVKRKGKNWTANYILLNFWTLLTAYMQLKFFSAHCCKRPALHSQKLSSKNTFIKSLYKRPPKFNLCNHKPWSEGNGDPRNASRWNTHEGTEPRLGQTLVTWLGAHLPEQESGQASPNQAAQLSGSSFMVLW